MEYAINIIDILTDLGFAYSLVPTCIGWTVTLLTLSSFGFIGFVMKVVAQCYRREQRIAGRTRGSMSSTKHLYWKKDCSTGYFFGICGELLFEGLCIGVIQAILAGDGAAVFGVKFAVILIKMAYCLYMVFKYFNVSKEDPMKIWLIMLSLSVMLIVYAVVVIVFADIFARDPSINCME